MATLLDSTLAVAEVYLAQAKLGTVLAALNPYWPSEIFAPVISRSAATAFVYDARFDELDRRRCGRELPEVRLWIRVGGPAAGRGRSGRADGGGVRRRRRRSPRAATTRWPCSSRLAPPGCRRRSRTRTPALWRSRRSCGSTSHSGARRSSGPVRSSGGSASSRSPRRPWRAECGWSWRRASAPRSSSRPCPREQITHISVTPSFFAELLSSDAHADVDLSSLRVAMLGGEPLLPSLQRRILDRMPGLGLLRVLRADGGAVQRPGPPGRRAGRCRRVGPHRRRGPRRRPRGAARRGRRRRDPAGRTACHGRLRRAAGRHRGGAAGRLVLGRRPGQHGRQRSAVGPRPSGRRHLQGRHLHAPCADRGRRLGAGGRGRGGRGRRSGRGRRPEDPSGGHAAARGSRSSRTRIQALLADRLPEASRGRT